VDAKEFELHDFVVMPDHIHLLITVDEGMSIEKAMQPRADSEDSLRKHREYIALNPVRAGLAANPGEYPYCFRYLADKKLRRG